MFCCLLLKQWRSKPNIVTTSSHIILLTKFSLLLCVTANVQWCKQITTATSSTGVVDADSWGEYVTVACQVSTLSKRCPNGDYGVSPSCAFTVSKTQGIHNYWKLWYWLCHKTGLHVVGFGAVEKGHFQACTVHYFWALLLPVAAVDVAICKSLMIRVEPRTSIWWSIWYNEQ